MTTYQKTLGTIAVALGIGDKNQYGLVTKSPAADGADARIAYTRLDNVYTPATGKDAVFAELGAGK